MDENLRKPTTMRILQRTPQGLFFMHETDTGSREWLLPSEVDTYIYVEGWQLVNNSGTLKDGWVHWVNFSDISAASQFINSLITQE